MVVVYPVEENCPDPGSIPDIESGLWATLNYVFVLNVSSSLTGGVMGLYRLKSWTQYNGHQVDGELIDPSLIMSLHLGATAVIRRKNENPRFHGQSCGSGLFWWNAEFGSDPEFVKFGC